MIGTQGLISQYKKWSDCDKNLTEIVKEGYACTPYDNKLVTRMNNAPEKMLKAYQSEALCQKAKQDLLEKESANYKGIFTDSQ